MSLSEPRSSSNRARLGGLFIRMIGPARPPLTSTGSDEGKVERLPFADATAMSTSPPAAAVGMRPHEDAGAVIGVGVYRWMAFASLVLSYVLSIPGICSKRLVLKWSRRTKSTGWPLDPVPWSHATASSKELTQKTSNPCRIVVRRERVTGDRDDARILRGRGRRSRRRMDSSPRSALKRGQDCSKE